jgi:hypothetical protein
MNLSRAIRCEQRDKDALHSCETHRLPPGIQQCPRAEVEVQSRPSWAQGLCSWWWGREALATEHRASPGCARCTVHRHSPSLRSAEDHVAERPPWVQTEVKNRKDVGLLSSLFG